MGQDLAWLCLLVAVEPGDGLSIIAIPGLPTAPATVPSLHHPRFDGPHGHVSAVGHSHLPQQVLNVLLYGLDADLE